MAGKLSMGKSILVRAVAALIVVGVIPLLLVAKLLIKTNNDAMKEQVQRTHHVAARTAADRISAFINAWQARCGSVASNELVIRNPKSPEAQEILQSLIGSDSSLAAVEIFDPSGQRVIAALGSAVKENLDPWFGRPILGSVELVGRGNERWLIVSARMTDSLATVQMMVEANEIDGMLNPRELGSHAEMGLIDKKGALLAPQGRRIESFPSNLVAFGRTATLTGAGEYSDRETGEFFGAYAPVAQHDWVVLSKQPKDIAYEVQRSMRVRSMQALALTLGLTIILSGIAYAQLVRPIRQLVAAQRKLAGGSSAASGGSGSEIQQL